MDRSPVEIEREGTVATLWLNRPDRRNALSSAVVDGLLLALDAVEQEPAIRAVVLAARGPVFCAGGDLADGMAGAVTDVHGRAAAFARLMERIPELSVPVVAAVQGDAMGGGCGLVAACDLAIADPAARMGLPEVRIGLFPWIILAALRRSVPQKALMELVLTGERIDAARAAALGLVNRVSVAGEAYSEALALARTLADRPPWAVAMGKRAFHQVADLAYPDALRQMQSMLTLNLMTDDAREGVDAFLHKRPPLWKGT